MALLASVSRGRCRKLSLVNILVAFHAISKLHLEQRTFARGRGNVTLRAIYGRVPLPQQKSGAHKVRRAQLWT
jgi:hypothetical protein